MMDDNQSNGMTRNMDIVRKNNSTVNLRSGMSRQETRRRQFESQRFLNAQRQSGQVRSDGSVSSLNSQLRGNDRRRGMTKRNDKRKCFVWVQKSHSKMYNIVGGVIFFIIVIGLFVFTGLTSVDIFFWAFSLSLFYWHIDSCVSIGGALVCLVSIPILLILENNFGYINGEVWAEEVAVWVYFFLVIGVVKQIYEYMMESKSRKVKNRTGSVRS